MSGLRVSPKRTCRLHFNYIRYMLTGQSCSSLIKLISALQHNYEFIFSGGWLFFNQAGSRVGSKVQGFQKLLKIHYLRILLCT